MDVDRSNVPGNPLRSYRMAMLMHGFVDEAGDDGFTTDERDPMSYSVVRLRRDSSVIALVAAMVVLVAIVIAVIVLAA